MLRLSQVAPHEWEFVWPNMYDDLRDEFNAGCEAHEADDLGKAKTIFRAVLSQMPDHLDAIHHLAIILSELNLVDEARDLWEQAVRVGRKAFPKDFEIGEDRLEWGWLENRPFLRCLHGLALARYEEGKIEEALRLFQELLSLNPNDNQGVRAMALEALFKVGKFEDALKITEQYPRDIMSETIYGRALALFKLGRREEATVVLRKAVEHLPLVGRELLKTKHRLPKTARPDVVTLGGADEAYYYWEHWGQFWKQDAEALEGLKEVVRQVTKTHRSTSQ
ncbi:MAG: tetratricopeptide repeat protein [Dehalococcoidia bacterium]|nr:tetratricopeptide repeat protein [Dehalococcoidia bacterium]